MFSVKVTQRQHRQKWQPDDRTKERWALLQTHCQKATRSHHQITGRLMCNTRHHDSVQNGALFSLRSNADRRVVMSDGSWSFFFPL